MSTKVERTSEQFPGYLPEIHTWTPEGSAPDSEPFRSEWLKLVDILWERWAEGRPGLWDDVEESAWEVLRICHPEYTD